MKKRARGASRGAGLILGALLGTLMAGASSAGASVPADKFDYAREVNFTYDAQGRVVTSKVEPSNAQCSKTTLSYDASGHVRTSTSENCAGASGDAVFVPRTVTSTAVPASTVQIQVGGAPKSVAVPAGLYIRTVSTTVGDTTVVADPRFGLPLSSTAPNQVVTTQSLDELGRVVLQVLGDGTKLRTWYCLLAGGGRDLSSNDGACGTPEESLPDAVAYVQTQRLSKSDVPMGPWQRAFSDGLGRTLRVSTQSFDGPQQPSGYAGAVVVQDTVYDAYGMKLRVTQPYFLHTGASGLGGSLKGTTEYAYNALGQVVQIREANAQGRRGSGVAVTDVVYEGLSVRTTNDASQEKLEERNALGQLVRVTDAAGAQIAYRYDAFGHPETIRDALDNRHVFERTTLGWVTRAKDPDRGLETFTHDALGRVRSKLGPLQTVATRYAYDAEGRLVSREDPEYRSEWTYDTCANGAGQLCGSKTSTGVTRSNRYDGLGRLVSQKTSIANGPGFAWAMGYDAQTGRADKTVYPSGLVTRSEYTALGYPLQVKLQTALNGEGIALASGAVLWRALEQDARGQVTASTVGGVTTTRVAVDALTGRVTGLQAAGAATVLDLELGWDSVGNLSKRVDHIGAGQGAVTETFSYGNGADMARNVNRLTQYSVSSPGISGAIRTVELRYNALGMMLFKSDVGTYAYGPQGPEAVRPHAPVKVAGVSYRHDEAGNVIWADGGKYRALSFTSFNRPADTAGVAGETESYGWLYDEDYQRIKETRTVSAGPGAGTRTQWYLNPDDVGGLGFEREESQLGANPAVISNRHYVQAFGQTVGAIVSGGALPELGESEVPPELASMAAVKVEYWHKDHLGSLVATSDQGGAVTARYSYDPFGKRRDAAGAYDQADAIEVAWGAGAAAGTGRGFTGHEHLDDVGLVNMNGRLFDARLGVFVQADPVRGQASNAQNYAAYAYALNNPLNATDPSGFDSEEKGKSEDESEGGLERDYRPRVAGISLASEQKPRLGNPLMVVTARLDWSATTGVPSPGTQQLPAMVITRKFEFYVDDERAKGWVVQERAKQMRAEARYLVRAELDALDRLRRGQLREFASDCSFAQSGCAFARMVDEEAFIFQGERQGLETVTMLEFVPQGRGAAVVGAAIRGVVGRWTTRATARSLIHCGCCFVGDTPVLTAEGLMPIEKVTVGTLVQSRDEHTGEVALKPVTDLIRHDNRALYGLTLIRENGRSVRIESSDNHPFWVEGQGWVDSAKLRRGMKVPSFNGEQLTVVNVQALGRSGKTFNLTVADFHTFFAGEASAYVHNQCPCALAAKEAGVIANGIRGRASEARVLQELGLTKNTTAVSTAEGRSIPDALTKSLSVEVKDVANASLTRQLRIQTEAARAVGRESVLITGENTCVSGACSRAFDTIIRRSDLGPR
ncbi:polymorphic toxin-type HINT domain-containing protein [Roseateles sp. MS654]|uniref:polymorphic toxin-type HINT domain-containing protein n=1 Tax=Roseateles sp. MS654 TaxID=3412685 RepID=UPI003C2CD08E